MSEQNIQVAKEIYAVFKRGDIASIMEHVSDDLEGFEACQKLATRRFVVIVCAENAEDRGWRGSQ
jgi:ketosteroid isomerase-like protein